MKNKVIKLVDEAIALNKSLFLIDLVFSQENGITVTVDGDDGVVLSECIRISRHIEHNLDREEEDFSLEVTSPNATDPIVVKRQYNKNINRTFKVKTETENFEGKLIDVNEKNITLQWKTREPKPIGKGKVTVVKQQILPYEEIIQAKVKITF